MVKRSQIENRICYREKFYDQAIISSKVHSLCAVLSSLKLIKKSNSNFKLEFSYCGPNVYQEWLTQQNEKFGAQLKLCSTRVVRITRAQLKEKGVEIPRPRHMVGVAGSGQNIQSMKKALFRDQARIKDLSQMEEQQQRSVKNAEIICKCGKEKYMTNSAGNRVKVKVGFHKRSRCKKCVGCLAKKCDQCVNCLNPRNKQSCIDKICLFPIIPKCPCFQ